MLDSFILRLRRGETPFFRRLKSFIRAMRSLRLPVPGFLLPLFRIAYQAWHGLYRMTQRLETFFLKEPMFRARCVQFGERVLVSRLPFIYGHPRIYVGSDVNFFGSLDVFSGAVFDEPRLVIGDRVDIGHNVVFVVNKEIVIEEDVNVASGVRFMDTDSHPRDTTARIADLGPPPDEIKPVRVGKYAWIGQNSFILKGVTIGEGAIIGVNSVVVTDIPAYCVAMGNPARVVMKGLAPVVTGQEA